MEELLQQISDLQKKLDEQEEVLFFLKENLRDRLERIIELELCVDPFSHDGTSICNSLFQEKD